MGDKGEMPGGEQNESSGEVAAREELGLRQVTEGREEDKKRVREAQEALRAARQAEESGQDQPDELETEAVTSDAAQTSVQTAAQDHREDVKAVRAETIAKNNRDVAELGLSDEYLLDPGDEWKKIYRITQAIARMKMSEGPGLYGPDPRKHGQKDEPGDSPIY